MTVLEKIFLYLEGKVGGFADFVLKALLALIIYFVARKLIGKLCVLIRKNMLKFHADVAITSFVVSLVKYSLNIFLVLTIIVQLNLVKESSITAAIASAGVAISLALQGGLSNLAGGVLILLLKPFKAGDYIIFPNENQEGTVRKIEMYYTTISSVDNRIIMIPNANLTNSTIVNVTAMEKRKLEIKVGVSYSSDLKEAKGILQRLVEAEPRFLAEEQQFFVDSLGESSITVGLRAWVRTDDYWPVKWEMNEKIKQEFDQAGIEIPYPQLDVHLKEQGN
ncbi:MAG TPA: mechanosensitive ion channel [Candidatus Fusicatenibacter intestinigallinarum]|uniref:Mechanosensitive ion channel n=1 Tax=Candidatus Fusicatenibacter intestinigallinarum TaxID=2838598 RepID=A0A9D2SML3_9FIRM|nr:mechanosensitive ion channel [Candidatus Fusicatenibacter intestinigallinarum]